MFKCKITLEEFDKDIKSGSKVELAEIRNLAKASVKKLATAEETKTPFFLSKNYFEDKGKPIGSFLAFGENKKLEMKFAKEEIKGKGSTKDAKGAAYGEAYVKSTNNIQFIYFEPDANCKVPANAWPKLLKSLKSMFGGMKALVVIEGQTIEEEAGEDENSENVVVETPKTQVSENFIKNSANGVLAQSIDVIKAYNRNARSTALETTTTWLEEYKKIPMPSSELKKFESKILETNIKLKELESIEKSIDTKLDPIFKQIDNYLANIDPKGLKMLADSIKKNLDEVISLVKKVGDAPLLAELSAIVKLLK